MSSWADMMEALQQKPSVSELRNSSALKILDAEVKNVSEVLRQSKNALAEILKTKKERLDKAGLMRQQVVEFEGFAAQALNNNDEKLAAEIAGEIVKLETRLGDIVESAAFADGELRRLGSAIEQTEVKIKRLKQQVDTVLASNFVRNAQNTLSQRQSNSKSPHTALDSLAYMKNIRARDNELSKRNKIADVESKKNEIKRKLEKSGIRTEKATVNIVLNRIRKTVK